MIERQELYCHNCDRYVQFDLDTELEGNHILNCPNCGHEHCRVVHNGQITDQRWASRNSAVYTVATSSITSTNTSTFTTSSASTATTYNSWLNTTSWGGTDGYL